MSTNDNPGAAPADDTTERVLARMREAAIDGRAIASVTHHARQGSSFDVDVMEAVARDEQLFRAVSLRYAEHHPGAAPVAEGEPTRHASPDTLMLYDLEQGKRTDAMVEEIGAAIGRRGKPTKTKGSRR